MEAEIDDKFPGGGGIYHKVLISDINLDVGDLTRLHEKVSGLSIFIRTEELTAIIQDMQMDVQSPGEHQPTKLGYY